MTACMLLTFLTLLEFAIVGFIEKRREKMISKEKKQRKSVSGEKEDEAPTTVEGINSTVNTLGSSLDAFSAKLFPMVFLIFNVGYWSYYLYYYFVL